MGRIETYFAAGRCVVEQIHGIGENGSFLTMCLAAMNYASLEISGRPLTEEQKKQMKTLYRLGTQINDYYDLNCLDLKKYKQQRRLNVPPSFFSEYRKATSYLEKHRPNPTDLALRTSQREEEIVKYRNELNLVTNAAFWTIAFPKGDLNEHFLAIHYAIMALQVIDDWVGRSGDVRADRPSFYTAVCDPYEINTGEAYPRSRKAYRRMLNYYEAYLTNARESSPEITLPIVTAIEAVRFSYPTLVDFLRSISPPRNCVPWLVSGRDFSAS